MKMLSMQRPRPSMEIRMIVFLVVFQVPKRGANGGHS